MEKMERIFAAFVGFLLVLGHKFAEGCSCMPAHPQDHFCRADYAIKVTILSKKSPIEPGMTRAMNIVYQAHLDKVFKGEKNGLKQNDVVDIRTATSNAACGNAGLEEGKSYVLTGMEYSGIYYHSSCNLAIDWKQVTMFQRKGLRNFYRKSCEECSVRPPFGYYSSSLSEAKQCSYTNPDHFSVEGDDCEAKYSTCLPRRRNGSCSWHSTPAYDDCVAKRDLVDGSGFESIFFL